MRRNNFGFAQVVLAAALVSFGFDLFHFSHHLGHDSTLLKLSGVLPKLIWKGILISLVALLLISEIRIFVFFLVFGAIISYKTSRAFAERGMDG